MNKESQPWIVVFLLLSEMKTEIIGQEGEDGALMVRRLSWVFTIDNSIAIDNIYDII